MPRGRQTGEIKQDILRDILRIMHIPSRTNYFSKGSTVTRESLIAIRDKLNRLIQSGKLNV